MEELYFKKKQEEDGSQDEPTNERPITPKPKTRQVTISLGASVIEAEVPITGSETTADAIIPQVVAVLRDSPELDDRIFANAIVARFDDLASPVQRITSDGEHISLRRDESISVGEDENLDFFLGRDFIGGFQSFWLVYRRLSCVGI